MRSSSRIARLSSTGTVTNPMLKVPFQIVATGASARVAYGCRSARPVPARATAVLTIRPFRRCVLSRPGERREVPACCLCLQQVPDRAVAVDHRRVVLEQTAGVGARAVGRVKRLSPEAQIHGELAAVVRRVCEAAREHPGARTRGVEERRLLLEPRLRFPLELR